MCMLHTEQLSVRVLGVREEAMVGDVIACPSWCGPHLPSVRPEKWKCHQTHPGNVFSWWAVWPVTT